MKIAIKLSDATRKEKRGWHASCRIRGHWLADNWDELDDIFYPDYFKQEYHDFFRTENQMELLKDYDVVILHKAYEYRLAEQLKLAGKKLIMDLSDPDYLLGFSTIGRAGMCLMTMNYCDAVVVNSVSMMSDLYGYGKPVFFIPDRIDFKKISAQKKEHREKIEEIVWFGHSDNFLSIKPYVSEITKNYRLRIIADKPIDGCEFTPYDPDTICQEIIKSDLIILGDKLSRYKSNNRVVLSWALGMPVINLPKEIKSVEKKEQREDLVSSCLELVKDFDIKKSVEEYKDLLTKI